MAAAIILAFGASAANAAVPKGVWANPRNTVHVSFAACGPAICGRVIWASPQAEADARRGTGKPLTGSMLFQNFTPAGPGVWQGAVLVPDIGQTVSGTIEQVDAQTLRGEGCVFAGFGCKTQTWKRVK